MEPSWRLLEALGGILERLGAILEGLGAILEAPGRLQGVEHIGISRSLGPEIHEGMHVGIYVCMYRLDLLRSTLYIHRSTKFDVCIFACMHVYISMYVYICMM